jgi:Sec-independent protein translocase protein TatA
VAKGFAYMGLFGLVLTVIPLLLFGPMKIRGYAKRNGAHEKP